MLKYLSNNYNQNSLANKLRKKRFELFSKILREIPKPIKILDVGGEPNFWQVMGVDKDLDITLLNLHAANHPGFTTLAGDARAMPQFKDKEFDMVFSNSVIEHVGDYSEQKKMADEIIRVGKRYFVQTPAKYFPIEPHFLVPYFQLMPLWLKMFLVMNFKLGWTEKVNTKEHARELAESVKLLSESEFTALFPGSELYREKFMGMTKSFIVYC